MPGHVQRVVIFVGTFAVLGARVYNYEI